MNNLIKADFTDDAKRTIFDSVVKNGIERTEYILLFSGHHPSYVSAIIKHSLRKFNGIKKTGA